MLETQHLEGLKTLIQQYQLSQDRELLFRLIVRIDGLIINTITKLKRRRFLQYVPLNDIYNSAVVGVITLFNTLYETTDPVKLPALIQTYVRNEVYKQYQRQRYEDPVSCLVEVVELDGEEFEIPPAAKGYPLFYNHIDEELEKDTAEMFKLYLEIAPTLLNKRESRILQAYYIEDKTLQEIGKEFHISKPRTAQLRDKALRKLRKRLSKYL